MIQSQPNFKMDGTQIKTELEYRDFEAFEYTSMPQVVTTEGFLNDATLDEWL